jgi:hypothetical protein
LIVANPEFAAAAEELRGQLADLHRGFFSHRLGSGVPLLTAKS